MSLTSYILDRSLCPRCGNDGTLKHEGKLEGCPDCPRGREVNLLLAEIHAGQAGDAPYGWCIAHGEDWDEGGRCGTCAEERAA